ncbi:MAG TPA: Crp/Fnr family transcriptional regulator [Xanthobacteraceae bacterium]
MADATSKVERQAVAGATMSRTGMLLSRPLHHHDNRVLADLPPSELALLAPHVQIVSLPVGTVLRHQDAALDHVYFPHQGVISLLATTAHGETIEVASAGRGGAICPILASEPRDGLLTTIAHGPLRASRVPAARLHAILPQIPMMGRAMDACREALLLQLRQNLICCGLHAVEHRLARWLLETADRLESEMIPATQEQVAQRLGVRRTTVTLLASKLQENGAIRWGRSRTQVLDRTRLEAMACGCYAVLHKQILGPLSAGPTTPPDFAG